MPSKFQSLIGTTNILRSWLMMALVSVLIVLVLVLLGYISVLQGTAHVVNYAGIVRGGTQQLIKQELNGYPDDALVARLDGIIDNLQTGEGSFDLVKLESDDYQDKLATQKTAWEQLKQDIVAVRADKNSEFDRTRLYGDSETYFVLADTTVAAAEDYSDDIVEASANLEHAIVALCVVIMVLILVRAIETIHLMRKNSQLSDYAYIDGATGLYNKRRCIDQLGRTNVLKPQCETCCLMFDLNDLKVTNDRFGHEAGDDLIRRFACALRESAPDDMFLGRFGGDEFIGIVDNVHEREIQEFLSRLEAAAKRSEYDNEQPLSYAYGVAFAQHTEGETLQSLLDQADAKMYERKAQMKSAASRDTHGSPAYDSDSSSARISC